MRIVPEALPEIGCELNWAMCRNPMCGNFGVGFVGDVPDGGGTASDARYTVRVSVDPPGRVTAEITCRACGQRSRLGSNRAIRPIVRHFLSLSLPFSDCPNDRCENHGVNVFEHWPEAGEGQSPYRATTEHTARCNRCRTDEAPRGPSVVLGTPRKAANRPESLIRWQAILDGLQTRRSVAHTTDTLGISHTAYHRHLDRLGARLRDYHAFRNAQFMHPDTANPEKPVSLHTGVMQVSARANARLYSGCTLPVVVTVASVSGANFVLAAHPCFLPRALCPPPATVQADRQRSPLESRWDAVQHPLHDEPDGNSGERKRRRFFDPNLDGYRIRSPYAALAHFLVVQKMLSRFRVIHNTIDAADGLFPAALVAYRDRILAGRPEAEAPAARPLRAPRTAELVLFSYARSTGLLKTAPTGRPPPTLTKKSPDDAWWAAEKRFAEQPVPAHLEREGLSRGHPWVRAALFRQALKGAYSKAGGWAWLHHPPEAPGYRDPHTLWLTRTPHKTYERHGRPLLDGAGLQPLHRVFNAIRHQVRGASRPFARAGGADGTPSRVAVVLNELAIYLLLRNYGLTKRPTMPGTTIPAEAVGLADEDEPDPAEIAWRFRIGIEHARQISRWRRG